MMIQNEDLHADLTLINLAAVPTLRLIWEDQPSSSAWIHNKEHPGDGKPSAGWSSDFRPQQDLQTS
jgi:hypothetical protein